MSAANTGTPAAEKPSASTCSVTVLPVPVAPVTRPWRLASFSSTHSGHEVAALAAAADQHLPVLDVVGGIAVRERGCGAIGCSSWHLSRVRCVDAIQYRACTVAKHGRLST